MDHEISLRLGAFVGFFCVFAVWETWAPRSTMVASRAKRWLSNLGIVVINSVAVRAVFPLAAVGLAAVADQRCWGLLNQFVLPDYMAVIAALLLLDLAIYLQHVMFHAVPLFWRLHMVHHSDMDFDVTTGVRFHPIEILLSMLIKFSVIVLAGPPVMAVLVFEITLNATSLFNHSNVRLPRVLERYLRWIIVTPDMHRIHHSVVKNETNSNFGFNLPWWDRLFGTYRNQPASGQGHITIGLRQFRDPARLTLPRLLILPFVSTASGYAINARGDDSE
ncbi:MAG: sterol desaturase [Gammaproteobacteria bacterium]|nr:MAG: sterol desaturase [Gammaproteobacteria bacterium]TND03962.1 MAG: sterol desaturase [Gammaproteobacteria bacterium]